MRSRRRIIGQMGSVGRRPCENFDRARVIGTSNMGKERSRNGKNGGRLLWRLSDVL